MIRQVNGTIFLTAEAFRDRYRWSEPDVPFSYATGNLVAICKIDAEARELRCLVYDWENRRKLKLSHVAMGAGRFRYFATRLGKEKPDAGSANSRAKVLAA